MGRQDEMDDMTANAGGLCCVCVCAYEYGHYGVEGDVRVCVCRVLCALCASSHSLPSQTCDGCYPKDLCSGLNGRAGPFPASVILAMAGHR